MTITLTMPTTGATNYSSIFAANFAAIEAAVNSLSAQISAAVGEGAALLLDTFDRPGLVGSRSYVLDLEAYDGGSTILIGHRPAANVLMGDLDLSIAWGVFGGEQARVTLTGDAELDAAAITTGLPKTIYVGIPSDGTPQLYEDTSDPDVLYAYSMLWDGFTLDDFTRMAPILPGYDLIRDMVNVQREFALYDNVTDFLEDDEAQTSLITPGDQDDNEIGVKGSREILGFFIDFPGDQEEGLYAPAGEDNVLTLQIQAEAVDWTEVIEIDASQEENFFQIPLHEDIDRERFVTEMHRFKLVRVSVGGDIVSAGNFTWGYYWRPMLGMEVPIDTTKVDLV